MAAMPPGSYLTISHPAIDIHQSQANAQRVYNERVATPQTLRWESLDKFPAVAKTVCGEK